MANSLAVALAALVGVVLAGGVAHGAWQARRAGPNRAAVEPTPRREPVLESPCAPCGGATAAVHPAGLGPAASEPRPARRASPRRDALIDAIAPLTIDAPIAGEVALMHLPTTRRAGSKPFLIEGLNAD